MLSLDSVGDLIDVIADEDTRDLALKLMTRFRLLADAEDAAKKLAPATRTC
jgi:hypothetical protein